MSRGIAHLPYKGERIPYVYSKYGGRQEEDLVKTWQSALADKYLHPFVLYNCPPVGVSDYRESIMRSLWSPTTWDYDISVGEIIIWVLPPFYLFGWGLYVPSDRLDVVKKHMSLLENIYIDTIKEGSGEVDGSRCRHHEKVVKSLLCPAQHPIPD
jgi:hypothetical protein